MQWICFSKNLPSFIPRSKALQSRRSEIWFYILQCEFLFGVLGMKYSEEK
jgi:hypothetical protein